MSEIKHIDDQNWSAKTVLTEEPVVETAEDTVPWTNELANKEEPHLRDLEITVDGLNKLDIRFPGSSAWAPRFTVQLSGDIGLDENGKRVVFNTAAELLSHVLLNDDSSGANNTFVPHANISREYQDADIEQAVVTTNRIIDTLLTGSDLTDVEEHGETLRITVRTIDFDLVEKPGPVEPTEPTEPVDGEGGAELLAKGTYKDVPHTRYLIETDEGTAAYWVPTDSSVIINNAGDIPVEATVHSLGKSGVLTNYRLSF